MMDALHWLFVDHVFWMVVGSIGLFSIVIIGVALGWFEDRGSFGSDLSGDYPPDYVPVRTWRDDFGAWKRGDITLDEFLDRRWDFRQGR